MIGRHDAHRLEEVRCLEAALEVAQQPSIVRLTNPEGQLLLDGIPRDATEAAEGHVTEGGG